MSPEGRYAFAVDNEDKNFHFLDTKQGNSVLKLPEDCRRAYPEMGRPVVQYSNSDNLVLVRCDDGDDLLYSLTDVSPLELFSNWSKVIPDIHASEVQHRMSADGRYLLYSFRDDQQEGFALVEIGSKEPVWSHSRDYEQDLSLAGINPSADYLYLYHPPGKRIEVVSPSDGQQRLSLTLERELVEIKLIGNQILLLDNDGQTEVYDLTSGELAWRYEDSIHFRLMAAHAGEGKVVLASKDGDMRWLDLSSGELLRSLSGPEEPEALSFLGGGQYLLVQGNPSVLLDNESGKPHYPALEYQEHLALNEDASELIIVSDQGYVRRLPILLDDLASAAIEMLPVNRRCLNAKERKSFYLAPLTHTQKRTRQCVQP
jgi:putative pyrroloquinoline-quinone binding quinoprotein